MQQCGDMQDLQEKIRKDGYISAESDYGYEPMPEAFYEMYGMKFRVDRQCKTFQQAYEDDIAELEKKWPELQLLGY
jgi:hypothetical protein